MTGDHRRDDRGATTVETALVLPVALTLLAGVLLFGLVGLYTALADHAAGVGLRTASLRGTTTYTGDGVVSRYPDTAKVRTTLDGLLGGVLGGPSSVSLVVTSNARADGTLRRGQGDQVLLTVTYDVPAVRAAAQLVPVVGDDLAEALGTVTTSRAGRLE